MHLINSILKYILDRDNFGKSHVANFIDAGYNVIVAGDENVQSLTKGVASELGVTFGDSKILDPKEKFNAKISNLRPFIGNSKISEVSYQGVSLSLSPSKITSGFLYPLLKSSPQSKPRQSATLLAGFQARNNARALISGSLSFFSNEFYESNGEFLKEISKWVLKERAVLRVSEVHHSRVNETETPEEYTINDNVTFSFKVEELVDGKWVPYVTNDIQLEFRMVDPYIRRTLKPAKDGKYSLTFTIPDVYGVFTFRVNYRKYGYTRFEIVERTPVRPYRHTQYERFLEAATPYYLSSLSMLFGVFIFSIVFLYQKDDAPKEKAS